MQIKIVFLQSSDCFDWFRLEKELFLTTLLLDFQTVLKLRYAVVEQIPNNL